MESQFGACKIIRHLAGTRYIASCDVDFQEKILIIGTFIYFTPSCLRGSARSTFVLSDDYRWSVAMKEALFNKFLEPVVKVPRAARQVFTS